MPVQVRVTEMEKGPSKWAVEQGQLSAPGPVDRTLIIVSDGMDTSAIPGLRGSQLDVAELRAGTFGMFNHEWIPSSGVFECAIGAGAIRVSF